MGANIAKYQQLAEQGATAQAVYLIAHADGLNLMQSIKLLRELFGLSLVAAKEVTVTADGRYKSLSDYQASLIPALEKALYILEQEDKGKLFAEIRWNQAVIGFALLEPTSSGYVGEWVPIDSPQMPDFVAAIERDTRAEIEFGETKQRGVINANPALTGQIAIKVS